MFNFESIDRRKAERDSRRHAGLDACRCGPVAGMPQCVMTPRRRCPALPSFWIQAV